MAADRYLGDIIVPAHNEENVILRCLRAVASGDADKLLRIIVVANGCTDRTADRARLFGSENVAVLELPVASKTAAIRAAEILCPLRPRLYVDADVELHGASAVAVLERLQSGALAARPPIHYAFDQASWAVRRYYRARSSNQLVMRSLWGAGAYGLSVEGRSRFEGYPDVVAEDLWVDNQFRPSEIEIVECDPVIVHTPRTIAGLRRILRRTHRGAVDCGAAHPPDRSQTLREMSRLASQGPSQLLDALTYLAFATMTRLDVRVIPGGTWERDETSRGPQ